MLELPTPPEVSTPKPATIVMPRPQQTPHPTFTGELKRVTMPYQFKSPFKTPCTVSGERFRIIVPTPESTGPDTRWEQEPSGSRWSSESKAEGTITLTRPTRVVCPLTRFTAKQTPRGPTSSLPKRPILLSLRDQPLLSLRD